MKLRILKILDLERQTLIYPWATRINESNLNKDLSEDGKTCSIVYSHCSEEELDEVIERQISYAIRTGCDLEWKVYGHDTPHCLKEKLSSSSFIAEPQENFMIYPLAGNLISFHDENSSYTIKKVSDDEGLKDVQFISEEVFNKNFNHQIKHFSLMLEKFPEYMSLYTIYKNGEPAACGRIYFHPKSQFGELCGGKTRKKFRNQGLFTTLVKLRLKEAIARNYKYVSVDALPTSEPILKKQGFQIITETQPFIYTVSNNLVDDSV